MRFFTVISALCALAVSAAPEVRTHLIPSLHPTLLYYPPSSLSANIHQASEALTTLWRAYSGRATDHFYTTNFAEYENAINNLGYSGEGIACYVYTNRVANSSPFYRMYSPGATDHFYTTNAAERNNAIANLGYNDEGIAAYVYTGDVSGTKAFYRAYSGSARDHFYTTDINEMDNAVNHLGYKLEGIAAYVR